MDVSFGNGVEAAAGQQDDVGLGGLRHGGVPVRFGSVPPGSFPWFECL